MRLLIALLGPFLVAGSPAGASPHAPAATLSKETSSDLKAFAAVDSFAVGGVGIAGTMSRGEELSRAIAARPDAIAAFEGLATGDNPAGRVYAYWALRELDPDQKRVGRLSTRLQRDRSPVPAFSGCMRYESTVAKLVTEVASGQRISLAPRKAN